MDLELFDGNLFLGRPAKAVYQACASASELLPHMDCFPIREAVVWHIVQHDCSPVEGNRMLAEEIRGEDRLWGCWTILPPQTGEVIGDDFFDRMKRNRIVALRAFPALHRFVLGRTVFGSFLSELAERRIPLLLSPAKDITWADVYRLVEDFPRLTCVICDVGTWGVNRYTWPLLEAFPNVYLETSMLSLADGDLEATVGKFGAGRLLFGSGFPERYPEAAILQLLHAEIADEDKARIASGNMRALIGNVKL